MKFSKILVAALSLMLFSCSQEEDIVLKSGASSQNTTTNLKSLGLQDVQDLKDKCQLISESTEFLTMRSKAKFLSDNLNNINANANYINRNEFEVWLGNNLEYTKYATVGDGLADYDALDTACQDFYAVNDEFFVSLSGGTKTQIIEITEPFVPLPISNNSSLQCIADCFATAVNRWVDIADMYRRDQEWDAYVSQSFPNHSPIAESHLAANIDFLKTNFSNCVKDCF